MPRLSYDTYLSFTDSGWWTGAAEEKRSFTPLEETLCWRLRRPTPLRGDQETGDLDLRI